MTYSSVVAKLGNFKSKRKCGRVAPAVDLDRLRLALGQLVVGVQAPHTAGVA